MEKFSNFKLKRLYEQEVTLGQTANDGSPQPTEEQKVEDTPKSDVSKFASKIPICVLLATN